MRGCSNYLKYRDNCAKGPPSVALEAAESLAFPNYCSRRGGAPDARLHTKEPGFRRVMNQIPVDGAAKDLAFVRRHVVEVGAHVERRRVRRRDPGAHPMRLALAVLVLLVFPAAASAHVTRKEKEGLIVWVLRRGSTVENPRKSRASPARNARSRALRTCCRAADTRARSRSRRSARAWPAFLGSRSCAAPTVRS